MARVFPPVMSLARAPGAAGTVRLPGSKSLSNRVLLLAALARGTTRIVGLLESDDTRVMLASLDALGVTVRRQGEAYEVDGCAGRFPAAGARIHVGNSGLTIRTLVPAVVASMAAGAGPATAATVPATAGDPVPAAIVLEGVPRMHERPIGDLVDGLRALGADIRYLGQEGFPPLAVHAASLSTAAIRVRGATSSQFVTGVLQAAPLLARRGAVRIEVEGGLISRPYVEMTVALMARFGVQVLREGDHAFTVPADVCYVAPVAPVAVEGDASSASYFLAAGAIAGGPVRVTGAGTESLQGDVRFVDALEAMGARVVRGPDWMEASRDELNGVDVDCVAIPDAAMTLAVVALHAQGATLLRGIGSWRVKETDRIAAMAAELAKLGAQVDCGPDWLRIEPPAKLVPDASIATYDDHRVAMCFSLASLDGPHRAGVPLDILDPGCVAKTFPGYFDALTGLTAPVITLDGPTASGKGTIAQQVAQALGWHYLDSGALYRLLALAALRRHVSADDPRALSALAATLTPAFDGARVLLDGDDVTEAIRAEAVGETASRVAVLPAVREALVALQRSARRAPGLVADGRDMGTVIFPDARLKVFLTASAESRADRRYKQLIEKGFSANITDLLQDLRRRDARDTERASAPLKPAEGALLLDSTGLTIGETVDAVLAAWQGAVHRGTAGA